MRELRAKVEGLLLVVLIGGVEHPQRLKICTLEHCGLFIVLHREKCICVYVSMCCILKNKKRRENTRRTECLCAIDGWRIKVESTRSTAQTHNGQLGAGIKSVTTGGQQTQRDTQEAGQPSITAADTSAAGIAEPEDDR